MMEELFAGLLVTLLLIVLMIIIVGTPIVGVILLILGIVKLVERETKKSAGLNKLEKDISHTLDHLNTVITPPPPPPPQYPPGYQPPPPPPPPQ